MSMRKRIWSVVSSLVRRRGETPLQGVSPTVPFPPPPASAQHTPVAWSLPADRFEEAFGKRPKKDIATPPRDR